MTAIEEATQAITKTLEECSIEAIKELPQMTQAIRIAAGMKAMRAALTKSVVDELLMPLMGSPLGFRTDRDLAEKSYTWEIVRDCAIEAMIRDVRIVGNEMNIISGRAYFTKECFERKVSTFPGITNLALQPGVPRLVDGGALVPFRASWILDNKRMELVRDVELDANGKIVSDQRIPVKVNSGMGMDAILGKARRKMLAAIYDRISGTEWSLPEGDVIDVAGEVVEERRRPQEKKIDDLVNGHKAKHAAKNGGEAKPPEPERKSEPKAASAPAASKSADDLANKYRQPAEGSGEVPADQEPMQREPGVD